MGLGILRHTSIRKRRMSATPDNDHHGDNAHDQFHDHGHSHEHGHGGPCSAPHGPLSLEKLNNAVQEVQMMLNDKYALLSTPSSQLRALSERDRKQHGAYKELQTDQTKGLFFLSELDLKNSMLLKQGDATGKNILAVLRHVGRLREFKHGGHRCWHTR